MSTIDALVQAASAAVNRGQWNEAEQLWGRVLQLDPRNWQALYSLGVHAFRRGQLAEALEALQAAHASAPDNPLVLLSISTVLRETGDRVGELRAIDASLAAEPYFLAGLLAKAGYLERQGNPKAAAAIYRNALKVVPDEAQWPALLRDSLLHGRALVAETGRQLAAFLAERIGQREDSLTPAEAQRWQEAGAIFSGLSQPYPSVCTRFQIPRLPAIPFFEREHFQWVEALEAKTEAITAEMMGAMQHDKAGFKPYINYEPGVPVNQWKDLNHSSRWNSYFLWRDGQPVAEHLDHCPQTAQALAGIDMAEIGGLCPNAMFSLLAPHTRIPPHHGETNARAVVHLPLVVPEGCLYRVGFEQRKWIVGQTLIFDDTIEHEARNDSDELRVVLIFDAWNPLLSPAEREMVKLLSAAAREFHAKA